MDLAFIITTRPSEGHPKTAIVYSADVAVMSLAAYLRRHMHSDTPYADAVKDAAWAVTIATESIGASAEMQYGEVRVSVIRSQLPTSWR